MDKQSPLALTIGIRFVLLAEHKFYINIYDQIVNINLYHAVVIHFTNIMMGSSPIKFILNQSNIFSSQQQKLKRTVKIFCVSCVCTERNTHIIFKWDIIKCVVNHTHKMLLCAFYIWTKNTPSQYHVWCVTTTHNTTQDWGLFGWINICVFIFVTGMHTCMYVH